MTAFPEAVPGKAARRPGSLALRVISGIFAIPFLLGLAYFGNLDQPGTPGWLAYGGFICLASGLAAVELRGLLRKGGYAPTDLVLVGLAVVLPLDAWLRPQTEVWAVAPDGLLLIVVAVIASLVALVVRPGSDRSLVDWALSLGLALYLGALMQFFFPLRRLPSELLPGFWVIALLILSWVCDSTAYFVGGAIGRVRLAPNISPKKSVEGAVAGVMGAVFVGPLLGVSVGQPALLMAGYGLVIALATVVGDLVESFVKRQTGAKDSGVLIPGHGGLLDRMDSLLLCAPVAVVYLHAFTA